MDLGLILLTRNIASTKSSAVQNKRLTIRIYGFSSGPVMKSTARLIIVISLAINRKLSFFGPTYNNCTGKRKSK